MVYIINASGGDFQLGELPVQAKQWHSMNTRALVNVWQTSETSLEKADQPTFGSGVVVIS